MSFARCRPLRGLCLALATTLSGGCSSEEDAPPVSGSPTLVLAIDGMEWSVVLPLVRAGRMPHFERLMKRGCYGALQSAQPTASPVLWTTVATGKTPLRHGILNFAKPRLGGEELRLFDRRDRRTKALWNVFSDQGKRVHCVGWWMTFPAEEVDGVMVAQTNTVDQADILAARNVWKGSLREGVHGQVHPREEEARVFACIPTEDELDDRLEQIFGSMPHEFTPLSEALWENCRWSFRADATYVRVAEELAGSEVPDLGLVYLGGIDVTGHRFWRYMQPEVFRHPPPPEQVENFGEVIADYHVYVDQCLGELLEAYGPRTNVLLLSDHGMVPVNRDLSFDEVRIPEVVNSGNHQEAPAGVLLAAGPAFRSAAELPPPDRVGLAQLPLLGSLLDIAPTLYALHRIPLGQDLQGQVLSGLFAEDFQLERQPSPVPTHDDAEFEARRREVFQGHSPEDEAERLEQLRALGYLDGLEAAGSEGGEGQ